MSQPDIKKVRKVKRYEDGAMYLWGVRRGVTTNLIGRWQSVKDDAAMDWAYLEARAVLLGVDRMARVRRRRIERLRKKETKRYDIF